MSNGDIAGRNLCNPTAIFLALAMMLFEMGERELSVLVRTSVLETLHRGERTRDLGGLLSTTGFSEAVANEVSARQDNVERPVEAV